MINHQILVLNHVKKKEEKIKKKPGLTGFLRIAYTSSTKNDKRQGDQYENEP